MSNPTVAVRREDMLVTTPAVPATAALKALLVAHLDRQRRHVLGIIDGLGEEQMRRPVLASGWCAAGMLKHLSLAGERYWFRCVMGGESTDYFPTEPNGDWQVGDEESATGLIAAYRAEIAVADALIAPLPLDAPPVRPDPQWDEWGMTFPDLATVLMHVIGETATHAGHLDAVRELLDGRQWIVLD